MVVEAALKLQDFAKVLDVLTDKRYNRAVSLIQKLGVQALLGREWKDSSIFEAIEKALGYSRESLQDAESRKEFAGGQFPPPRTGQREQNRIGWSDSVEEELWMGVFARAATMLLETSKLQSKTQRRKLVSDFAGELNGAEELLRQADSRSEPFRKLCQLLAYDPKHMQTPEEREQLLQPVIEDEAPASETKRRKKSESPDESDAQWSDDLFATFRVMVPKVAQEILLKAPFAVPVQGWIEAILAKALEEEVDISLQILASRPPAGKLQSLDAQLDGLRGALKEARGRVQKRAERLMVELASNFDDEVARGLRSDLSGLYCLEPRARSPNDEEWLALHLKAEAMTFSTASRPDCVWAAKSLMPLSALKAHIQEFQAAVVEVLAPRDETLFESIVCREGFRCTQDFIRSKAEDDAFGKVSASLSEELLKRLENYRDRGAKAEKAWKSRREALQLCSLAPGECFRDTLAESLEDLFEKSYDDVVECVITVLGAARQA
jgi:hypothetical protein